MQGKKTLQDHAERPWRPHLKGEGCVCLASLGSTGRPGGEAGRPRPISSRLINLKGEKLLRGEEERGVK